MNRTRRLCYSLGRLTRPPALFELRARQLTGQADHLPGRPGGDRLLSVSSRT